MDDSGSGSRQDRTPLLAQEEDAMLRQRKLSKTIEDTLEKEVLSDESQRAKEGRWKRALRATYGEFICTTLFFTVFFGVVMNCKSNDWSTYESTYAVAITAGFLAVAMIYTFSTVSGANFNPNISVALWITGKLSNRRLLMYIVAQLAGSLVATALAGAMFHGDMESLFDACTLVPADTHRIPKVFATEFITTFVLTYVAFTVAFEDAESEKKNTMSFKGISDTKGLTVFASTPQSKTGFAPLAIGLTVFGLSMIGGSSGPAINQARMFGPAVISGKWDYFYVYAIAELLGGTSAALLVDNLHRLGLEHVTAEERGEAQTAAKALTQLHNIDHRMNVT